MSEKKQTKTTKKTVVKTETKAPKAPRQKKETEPLVVFAIRLTEAERKAIHDAAGPRGATRYVRAVAGAFATGDEAAFRALVKEAREARQ